MHIDICVLFFYLTGEKMFVCLKYLHLGDEVSTCPFVAHVQNENQIVLSRENVDSTGHTMYGDVKFIFFYIQQKFPFKLDFFSIVNLSNYTIYKTRFLY